MNKICKIYQEPYWENKEPDFQELVDRIIKTTSCVNGCKYHDNLKVMWVDLHNGRILWWCLRHSVMWNSLNERSK